MTVQPTARDRRIIDLHCDTLTECRKYGCGLVDDRLHLSLNKLPEGYRLCQAMAAFIPDTLRGMAARAYYEELCGVFQDLMRRNGAVIAQVADTAAVGEALEQRPFAAILTVEGGAVLAGDAAYLDRLYRDGVRMITLTWNDANEICGGAATDEGFTPFGRSAVARMEELGIAVDVSHLSDRGFWELCGMAKRPFVASHSNSRAVCGHRRNLTDDMFREIVRRGGLVGLNYYRAFIAPEGETEHIGDLLRHLHHFLDLGGEDVLALGSDFDGADMPPYLTGLDGVGNLIDAITASGVSQPVVEKIIYENARRFFARLGT